VPLELSQIVAELIEAVGFIGEVEGSLPLQRPQSLTSS
jgi:hypothetical protein